MLKLVQMLMIKMTGRRGQGSERRRVKRFNYNNITILCITLTHMYYWFFYFESA